MVASIAKKLVVSVIVAEDDAETEVFTGCVAATTPGPAVHCKCQSCQVCLHALLFHVQPESKV